jgi:hypothetical protein
VDKTTEALSRTGVGAETTGYAAKRDWSMAMIITAAAVLIMFTWFWIAELISPPGTLRMPLHAWAAAELSSSGSAYR